MIVVNKLIEGNLYKTTVDEILLFQTMAKKEIGRFGSAKFYNIGTGKFQYYIINDDEYIGLIEL